MKITFKNSNEFLEMLKDMEHRERFVFTLKDRSCLEVYKTIDYQYDKICLTLFEGFNCDKHISKKSKVLNPKYGSNDYYFESVYNNLFKEIK